MKKSELIRRLEPFSDDTEISIAYKKDTEWHDIDNIKSFQHNRRVMLETNDNPCMDGLLEMAQGLYDEVYKEKQYNHEDRVKLEDFLE